MTDFTKEFIAEARESITEPGVERYICIPVQLEMLDEIERLQFRIAELEAAQRWIPVNERMPKDCERVLVYADNSPQNYPRRAFYIYRLERWVSDEVNTYTVYGNMTITHWMPLPEPPEAQ